MFITALPSWSYAEKTDTAEEVISSAVSVTSEVSGILSDDELIDSYSDDGSIMTDEEFFGKYDASTDTWIVPSKLDYDKYSDMQAVKAAVMQGDYTKAKEACMNYYKNKYQSYSFSNYNITNDMLLGAELLMKNVYVDPVTGTTPIGIMSFPGAIPQKNPQNYTQLSLNNYKNMLKAETGLFSVYLMGIKKDGSSFLMDSKETPSGLEPLLEITQNGVTTAFSAVDDTYISPSENGLTRYGDNDDAEYQRLLVEESKSSINSPIAIDKNTKRAMIKFDLSNLDRSAEITDAKLKIFGYNCGTAETAEVLVCNIRDVSWNEETATWYMTGADGKTAAEHSAFSNDGLQYLTYVSSTPVKETIGDKSFWAYSYRYGEELCRFAHMHEYLVPLCVSNTEKYMHYGKVLLRQFIGYLNQWGNVPMHGKTLDAYCRNTVNPEMMGLLLAKTDIITPDIWSAHMKFHLKELEEHAKRCENNGPLLEETGNWLTYRIEGYMTMLAHFYELCNFEYYFEWLNAWEDTVFETSFNSDGSCTEVPFAYGMGSILSQQINIDTPFKKANISYRLINEEREKILKECFRFFLRQQMPDNMDPRIGDSAGDTSQTESFLSRAKIYNDPEMIYMASQGKEEIDAKPKISSFEYPDMGYYIMRSGFLADSLYLYTDNDGRVSGHTHTDDLAVVVKAYGNNLLTDQSYTSYNWTTGTNLAETQWHNTVEFDNSTGSLFTTSVGEKQRFEANNGYDNTTLSTNLYDNSTQVKHTRNILFIKPGYWIVNDYLIPAEPLKEHTYKQYWHMRPTAEMTLDVDTNIGRTNFSDQANIQVPTVKTDDITAEITPSYYSYGAGSLVNSKRLVYEQNVLGNAVFDTVLYPEKAGNKGKVSVSKLPLENVESNGATAMNICIEDTATGICSDADYYLVHDKKQQSVRSFGRYTTDGRMAYIENNTEKANLSRIFVQDTTSVVRNSDEREIFKSLSSVSELSVNISDTDVKIDSSVSFEINDITFYADNADAITKVYLNGNEIPFKKAGHYIFFGEEPILQDGIFVIADFTEEQTTAKWMAASPSYTNAMTGYYDEAFKMRWLSNSVGTAYLAENEEFSELDFGNYRAIKLNVKFNKNNENANTYFTVVLSTSEMNTTDNMDASKYRNNEILYKEIPIKEYLTGEYEEITIPLDEFKTAFDQAGKGAETIVGSTTLNDIKSISIFPGPANHKSYMGVSEGNSLEEKGWAAHSNNGDIWIKSIVLMPHYEKTDLDALDEYMSDYVSYGTRKDIELIESIGNSDVVWISDNVAIDSDGKVTKPQSGSVDVNLNAVVVKGNTAVKRQYKVTVYAPDTDDFVIVDFTDNPQAGADWSAASGKPHGDGGGNGWEGYEGGRYSLNWLMTISGATYIADHPEKFMALDVSDYSAIKLKIRFHAENEINNSLAVVLSTGTLEDNKEVYKNHEILYKEVNLSDYTPYTDGYIDIIIPFDEFKTAFDQIGNGALTPAGSTPLEAIKSISFTPIGLTQYAVPNAKPIIAWAFNGNNVGKTTSATLKSITLLKNSPLELYNGDNRMTEVNFEKIKASASVNAKTHYTNTAKDTVSITPVIAVYTDGVLKEVKLGEQVRINSKDTAKIITPQILYEPESHTEIKAYMWDFEKGMISVISPKSHSK